MTTDKYAFDEIEFSTQGWDVIMNAAIEKMDEIVHTNLVVTLGENVNAYQAVGIFAGETKFKKAQANGTLQPMIGISLMNGVLDDEILIQRVGPITNSGWSWTPGSPVFLSESVAGSLTQTPSTIQFIGMAISATTIILNGNIPLSALP
jgi:hypothetical protein